MSEALTQLLDAVIDLLNSERIFHLTITLSTSPHTARLSAEPFVGPQRLRQHCRMTLAVIMEIT